MPKIDIDKLPVDTVSLYPDPFRTVTEGRSRKRLGNAVGLSQFGVNLTTLKPGAWSSQRHWHQHEDEFIYIVFGEVVLCEDAGEIVLKAGDAAGFKAASGNGHRLINRTQQDVVYIEVGTRAKSEHTIYSDIDMQVERSDGGDLVYSRKTTGEPYPKRSV